jgi:radical SAM superfamily enzyme YgiQ (UPF0313 family)
MYCVYPIIFGKWRGRSALKIVDDLEVLANKYDVKVIWFEDQAFSMDIYRAGAICDEIVLRGLKVSWACETRADKLNKELLGKMKRAGCSRIQLGIETGDTTLFRQFGKSACKIETVKKSVKEIKDNGILVETNFIVGLPGENWQTVRNTAGFIDDFQPDILSVSLATPYPGTKLYEIAESNGWITTKDWNNYGLSKPILNMPTFTSQDMEKARDYLVSHASFKRQWGQTKNDLRSGRIDKVVRDAALNLPKIPQFTRKLLKRKFRSQ